MIQRHVRSLKTDQWVASLLGKEVTFRLVRLEDAPFILSLRGNPRLNEHLSTIDQDIKKQEAWIESYLQRENQGEEFYFVILRQWEQVGTIRLYDIQGDSFCWGSWIIAPGTSPSVALRSTAMIYDLGFNSLGFNFSHFEVRKGNHSVNRFHQRTGARLTSQDGESFYYLIDKNTALNATWKW